MYGHRQYGITQSTGEMLTCICFKIEHKNGVTYITVEMIISIMLLYLETKCVHLFFYIGRFCHVC